MCLEESCLQQHELFMNESGFLYFLRFIQFQQADVPVVTRGSVKCEVTEVLEIVDRKNGISTGCSQKRNA